jgi:NAD-dependent DNA ligase
MGHWTGEMRDSISPKVDGIVFICNDLDDKARLVIGARENRYRPAVKM